MSRIRVTGRIGLMFVATPLLCAGALLLPSASASAAVAPAGVPVLTSALLASPVTIHWTPGDSSQDGGPGHGHGNGNGHGNGHGSDGAAARTQFVVRAAGPCAAPTGAGVVVARYADGAAHDFSDAVGDGTYCYVIEVTDGETLADSPGLTVVVSSAAQVVPLPAPDIAPVAADPVATDPVGAGPVVAAPVARAQIDTIAPAAPAGIRVIVSRARTGSAQVPFTLRWSLPGAPDLARVDVVLNAKHAPRDRADGTVVYSGPGTSAKLTLRAGQKAFLALFAYDASGNSSPAARTTLAAPVFSSLRPLSGSSVTSAPLLTWKPVKGASYYNVQLFRNGKRVLVAWPAQASFRIPAATLLAGTYVWYVWPALGPRSSSPKFAALIGRATFDYAG